MRKYPRRFKKGQWKTTCERCGCDFHSSKIRREWNGLRVCSGPGTNDCYERRQPQDFVRAGPDKQTPPWTAPVPDPVFGSGNKDDL